MRKYAVIGLGRFGTTLARRLSDQEAEVIAIDKSEPHVSAVRDHVAVALRMDATDEKGLRAQGVGSVDVAIVGMGESFEATQLATVVLKRLGVKKVIVKAVDPLHEQILLRIGADEVISPEIESAARLSQKLLAPRIIDYLDFADGHSLVQIGAPNKFHGKSIRELDVRKAFGVNIVAIKKRVAAGTDEAGEPVYEEKIVDIPRPEDVIEPTDVLVLIGDDAALGRLAG